MKKILVVGGAGFIGQNIVEHLQKNQYKVGVYDIKEADWGNVDSYEGDIINDINLRDRLSQYDTVIYLISAIMPKESMDKPLSTYQTDIPLLITMLNACMDVGIKRIIYSSSGGTIYGNKFNKIKESDQLRPRNHYAICKLTCEYILMLYNELYQMENVVLRISNPYGRYQRIASGVGVVNTFINSALKNNAIDLWGDDDKVRDFVEIRHVAYAFEQACIWNFEENCVPIFNIGSGVGISLRRLIQIIKEETKVNLQINKYPGRPFDVSCNYLDIAKAQAYINYCTDINAEEDIREFVRSVCEKYSV